MRASHRAKPSRTNSCFRLILPLRCAGARVHCYSARHVSIRLRLLAFALSACAAFAAAALEAVPSRAVDLSGSWQLNAALSDDVEHMLVERQREEHERYLQWRRRQEKMYPPGASPIDVHGTGPGAQREPSSARRASMKRRQENLHKMLAISDTLVIKQEGASLDIVSAVESRRVVAGSRTQVSMPEGELADSRVGWDSQWFVIDRRVHGGPRVVERYRLAPKTGQLEYEMRWSGDTELDGMKIRRFFDRVTVTPPPADPAAGPVR
jgi:hypothetical protein